MSAQADTSRPGRLALLLFPSLRRELAMWQALSGMAENMATLAQLTTTIRDRLEDIQAANLRIEEHLRWSHEWNCTCVRCERERDWLDAVDDEPEREPPSAAREASEGDDGR